MFCGEDSGGTSQSFRTPKDVGWIKKSEQKLPTPYDKGTFQTQLNPYEAGTFGTSRKVTPFKRGIGSIGVTIIVFIKENEWPGPEIRLKEWFDDEEDDDEMKYLNFLFRALL